MALIASFVPTIRELREMHHLWNAPAEMSSAKLVAVLGHVPLTLLDEAVNAALEGMKCLATPSPVRQSGIVGKVTEAIRI